MNKNEISKKKYPSFNNSDYTKKIKPYFQKMLWFAEKMIKQTTYK